MREKLCVIVGVLVFAVAVFGQAELEKYVGQYQVTGAPIMITVTAPDGKLAIEVTGQGKAIIELIEGEKYSVKGTPIALTFEKNAAGIVTGMMIHQAPGMNVPASNPAAVQVDRAWVTVKPTRLGT